MSIINEIFLDSCVLIEYTKGNQTDFLDNLLENPNNKLFDNIIVISEFLFYYLAIKYQKSPLSVKESKQIEQILIQNSSYENFLKLFVPIEIHKEFIDDSIILMKEYNLLPNDALILSSCLHHKIQYLATFDKDLIHAGKSENLIILSNIENLKSIQ